MSESWWGEWWTANAQPIVDAYASKDVAELWRVVERIPWTYYNYIKTIYDRSPEHVIIETFLIVFILYISFVKKSSSRPKGETGEKLTESEIQTLCDEWEPEPLVPASFKPADDRPAYIGVVETTPSSHIKIQGIKDPLLNMATVDFLGMAARPEIKSVARSALTKYGCGSCGPRGFYGTIDTHEILEKDLASFIGTTDSITFSDLEATCSSVLPAYAKRGDLIVVDEGVTDSILIGVNLARCKTLFYKHNDMEDLERVLDSVRAADKKAGRASDAQRRYIVTEGLFRNSGALLPLPKVVELSRKHCFRLFLDETYSFGVLGATGKGITEHFNMSVDDVDILCGALSTTLAGVGGFSTGSQLVVDYQRINSAGYVFSASAPPYTSAVASESIRILKSEPGLLKSLRERAVQAHRLLSAIPGLHVLSDPISPVVHVRVATENGTTNKEWTAQVCRRVVEEAKTRGLAVVSPHLKPNSLMDTPLATVRFTLNANHTTKHVETACKLLVDAFQAAVNNLSSFKHDLRKAKVSKQ
ncbi:hypothetical protein H310_03982 [Aphanomyces invadans]|uniref:serine C-palmitoyltransferase n=1 Tax=Aphanomyces invadans TaxID=157072 RepID=A0A024UG65_9STRA|nr:hypothetical protein H310_03982 [Aphanomyces invadans]ETW04862.1 hypothetical protein H310_03982 [Aphanomyces invadans]|eukprot:XP_008866300.1 hypothetical protein H310_03982 [Aphanomyces invadans]